MCDYSVEASKTRKAAVGDQVVTSAIGGGNVAFVDRSESDCAICLTEGVGVEFDLPIAFISRAGWNPAGFRTARYVRVGPNTDYARHRALQASIAYKDWIQLPDGSDFPIAYLEPHQRGVVAYVPPKEVENKTVLQRVTDLVS